MQNNLKNKMLLSCAVFSTNYLTQGIYSHMSIFIVNKLIEYTNNNLKI